MTINVIRANVDELTTFFVDLEVSTRGDFCCLSYFIKASLNFSLSRQIHFYSLQYFFSDVLFGKNDNCITRKCAECTTNQHCLAEKYCSNYKCISPPNNRCNFNNGCPRNYECRYGSCQYVWSQQIRTTGRTSSKTGRTSSNTGSSIGTGSNAAIKFKPSKPLGFDNIRIV